MRTFADEADNRCDRLDAIAAYRLVYESDPASFTKRTADELSHTRPLYPEDRQKDTFRGVTWHVMCHWALAPALQHGSSQFVHTWTADFLNSTYRNRSISETDTQLLAEAIVFLDDTEILGHALYKFTDPAHGLPLALMECLASCPGPKDIEKPLLAAALCMTKRSQKSVGNNSGTKPDTDTEKLVRTAARTFLSRAYRLGAPSLPRMKKPTAAFSELILNPQVTFGRRSVRKLVLHAAAQTAGADVNSMDHSAQIPKSSGSSWDESRPYGVWLVPDKPPTEASWDKVTAAALAYGPDDCEFLKDAARSFDRARLAIPPDLALAAMASCRRAQAHFPSALCDALSREVKLREADGLQSDAVLLDICLRALKSQDADPHTAAADMELLISERAFLEPDSLELAVRVLQLLYSSPTAKKSTVRVLAQSPSNWPTAATAARILDVPPFIDLTPQQAISDEVTSYRAQDILPIVRVKTMHPRMIMDSIRAPQSFLGRKGAANKAAAAIMSDWLSEDPSTLFDKAVRIDSLCSENSWEGHSLLDKVLSICSLMGLSDPWPLDSRLPQ